MLWHEMYIHKHLYTYDVDVDICLLDNLVRALVPFTGSAAETARLGDDGAVTIEPVDADPEAMSLNRGNRIFKGTVGLGLILDSVLIGTATTDETDFPALDTAKDALRVFVLFGTWDVEGMVMLLGDTVFVGFPPPLRRFVAAVRCSDLLFGVVGFGSDGGDFAATSGLSTVFAALRGGPAIGVGRLSELESSGGSALASLADDADFHLRLLPLRASSGGDCSRGAATGADIVEYCAGFGESVSSITV